MIPRLAWCVVADADHKKNKRQYAHTYHRKNVICLANKFLKLPKKYQLGILFHEIGHLILGPRGTELQADRAAEGYFKIRIKYKSSRYGKDLQYVDKKYFGILTLTNK